mmetsp:Transcript_30401/g.76185  ORF Transcript_30401/g.76185 Transcript_30401/m.76185 type:complete len:241 (-) Transcript_30401:412-1134(-)
MSAARGQGLAHHARLPAPWRESRGDCLGHLALLRRRVPALRLDRPLDAADPDRLRNHVRQHHLLHLHQHAHPQGAAARHGLTLDRPGHHTRLRKVPHVPATGTRHGGVRLPGAADPLEHQPREGQQRQRRPFVDLLIAPSVYGAGVRHLHRSYFPCASAQFCLPTNAGLRVATRGAAAAERDQRLHLLARDFRPGDGGVVRQDAGAPRRGGSHAHRRQPGRRGQRPRADCRVHRRSPMGR